MPTALSDHILSLIRNVLVNQWDATRTAGYDPTLDPGHDDFLLVHTSAYSYNPRDPQVAVTSFEEGVLGGGVTGYTGMDGTRGTLNQDRDGTVLVDCWAEGDETYNGEHPQDLVDLLMKEVERVLHANATGTAELRRLAPGGPLANDDTNVEPVVYGQQVEVGYGWLKEAP